MRHSRRRFLARPARARARHWRPLNGAVEGERGRGKKTGLWREVNEAANQPGFDSQHLERNDQIRKKDGGLEKKVPFAFSQPLAGTFDEYLHWKQTKFAPRVVVQPAASGAREVAVTIDPVPLQQRGHVEPVGAFAPDGAREKIDREAKDATFLSLTSERNQTTFAWRDVTFTVPVKKGYLFNLVEKKTGQTKDILSHVSGYCRPGEILFVMGPSGAGKSTMLDALADRVKLPVEGVQWLDGKRKTESNLRRVSKYVQQDDCIMGALTVTEVMRTAASFYIADASKREPLMIATLKMVGLTEQADTKVRRFPRGDAE